MVLPRTTSGHAALKPNMDKQNKTPFIVLKVSL